MASKGRSTEKIFFVYDHNMLKKEEDDLKDAILFFYPDHVSEDDQCALCGQLMGMSEYLQDTLGKSSPQSFKMENDMFALKRVGNYTLGLQGRTKEPEIFLLQLLNNMYTTFVTFHGSIDSLRLRHKDDHKFFLSELYCIWSCILSVSVWSSSFSQTFQNLSYVDLPKSSSHLFVQASHLLQSSQRRPNVIAGAILYKNKVLCTQLSPNLTRQLTYLQQQLPHISRSTDFDLPMGCRLVTLFLTDDDLYNLHPPHPSSRRHCKGSDFHHQRENDRADNRYVSESQRGRHLARRLTYPNDLSKFSQFASNQVGDTSQGQYTKKEQRAGLFSNKTDSVGIERHTWSKSKQKVHLSHVPIVECRSGESGVDSEHEVVLGNAAVESHFAPSASSKIEGRSKKLSSSDQTSDCDSPKESPDVKMFENVHLSPANTDTGNMEGIGVGVQGKSQADSEKVRVSPNKNTVIHNVEVHASPENIVSNSVESSDLSKNQTLLSADVNIDIQMQQDLTSKEHDKFDGKFQGETVSKIIPQNVAQTQPQLIVISTKGAGDDQSGSAGSPQKTFQESLYFQVSQGSGLNEASEEDTSEDDEGDKTVEDEDVEDQATISDLEQDAVRRKSRSESNDLEPRASRPLSPSNKHTDRQDSQSEKENIEPGAVTVTDVQKSEVNQDGQCIACLDLQSKGQSHQGQGHVRKQHCSRCLKNTELADVVVKSPNSKTETFDFSKAGLPPGAQSPVDEVSADTTNMAATAAAGGNAGNGGSMTSSFSSNVSSDSTISRYWTHEMDGLNDITLYVQCHSDTSISLMLLMEDPVEYQENVLHALWKSSLPFLADLDYYISESDGQRQEELLNIHDNYSYLQYDKLSRNCKGNVSEVPSNSKEEQLHQMVTTLHADFQHSQCLTDIVIRNQRASCYGHNNIMEETFFQLDLTPRLTSGLPLSRDPNFLLDAVAQQKLAKDKNISIL